MFKSRQLCGRVLNWWNFRSRLKKRLMGDLNALMELPASPYDACKRVSCRASSTSKIRYRCNDHSIPVAYAHHEVQPFEPPGRKQRSHPMKCI